MLRALDLDRVPPRRLRNAESLEFPGCEAISPLCLQMARRHHNEVIASQEECRHALPRHLEDLNRLNQWRDARQWLRIRLNLESYLLDVGVSDEYGHVHAGVDYSSGVPNFGRAREG